MKPRLINANVYLYRAHFIVKRGGKKDWNIFPEEHAGVRAHAVKSLRSAAERIDSYISTKKRHGQLF